MHKLNFIITLCLVNLFLLHLYIYRLNYPENTKRRDLNSLTANRLFEKIKEEVSLSSFSMVSDKKR